VTLRGTVGEIAHTQRVEARSRDGRRGEEAVPMALNAFLRLKGETQGDIKGSVTQKGREDQILVIGAEHSVVAHLQPKTGLPKAKQEHRPYTITKEVDLASPKLYMALYDNERMKEWELQYWRPSKTGAEQQFYTVRLYDARVSSIHHEMLNNKYPENMQHKEREHVSFCYGKIEITWMDGGVTAGPEDWGTPIPTPRPKGKKPGPKPPAD
jgi:type VI secretion system secreted protein Hcp